jgi:hypothetical protein
VTLAAFVGPSLPAEDVRRAADCVLLPPARQGDVWRALRELRPAAIALIDGVFEAQPSVWHHEILDALESGVRVYGASSMGALRAAELEPFGMIGVGRVFEWVQQGFADDADVALLHADAEHGYRPLSLPHVTVLYAVEQARAAGVIGKEPARKLIAASEAAFYQDRSWGSVLPALAPAARSKWHAWAARGVPDVKALDAAACLRAAASGAGARRAPVRRRDAWPSSLVRRRKLRDAMPAVLDAVLARKDAGELRDAGLRRALLAAFARQMGLRPSPEAVQAAEGTWLASLGASPADRGAVLQASGMDDADARRLFEEVALEELVLRGATRMVNDGPSDDEAIAAEARLRGLWAASGRKR